MRGRHIALALAAVVVPAGTPTTVVAGVAGAGEGAAPPGHDPRPVAPQALDVRAADDGWIEIRGGAERVARFRPATPPDRRGPPQVHEALVAGHRVVEVRIPVLAAGGNGTPGTTETRHEKWIGEIAGGRAIPIASGVYPARDVDGETTRDIEIGAASIDEYQTAARLRGCDGRTPRLFVRAWDFQRRRFAARAPDPPPVDAAPIRAVRAARPAPAAPFSWIGATTDGSGRSDAGSLIAPLVLGDRDPGTAWIFGGPHHGRGEMAVARSRRPVAVAGIAVLPAETAPGVKARPLGRPARISFLVGATERFTIDLAGGAAADRDQPFVARLPRPVVSDCVAVVIHDVAPAGRDAAVAEIEVLAPVETGSTVADLVAETARGEACESAAGELADAGPPAAAPLARELPRAAGAGRLCLLEALARIAARWPAVAAEPELPAALGAALADASAAEEKILLDLLPRLPAPPVDVLARVVADARGSDGSRSRAARALAALPGDAAQAALVAAVGGGPPPVRTAVREALVRARTPLAARLIDTLAATALDAHARRADLVFALGSAAAREPGQGAAVLAALEAAATFGLPFEIRARAVVALGRMATGASAAVLARLRATDPDPVIRALAVRALCDRDADADLPAIRAALGDRDPRVREIAAAALGRRHDAAAAPLLVSAVAREPWPFVRRAHVAALGRLCGPAPSGAILRVLGRDQDDVRLVALSALAACRDPRAPHVFLRVLGRAAESPDLRVLAARLLGDGQHRAAAPEMAAALRRLLAESQADMSVESVAVAALQALARLGGPDAVRAAIDLSTDARPLFRRAAVDALAVLCDPDRGAAALRAALAAPDLAPAARAALDRCR